MEITQPCATIAASIISSLITVFGVVITAYCTYKQYKKQDYKKHVTDNRMAWLIRMKENCSSLYSLEFEEDNLNGEEKKFKKIKNLIIFDLNPIKDKEYIDFIKKLKYSKIKNDIADMEEDTKDTEESEVSDYDKFMNSFSLMFKAEWECIKDEVKEDDKSYSKDDKYKEIQEKMMKEIQEKMMEEKELVENYFIKDYIKKDKDNTKEIKTILKEIKTILKEIKTILKEIGYNIKF